MSSPVSDSLFLSPVTENEIEEEIAQLILKILKCELSGPCRPYLMYLFFTGIVPEKLTLARVIAVFRRVLRQAKTVTDLFLYSLFLINC